MKVLVTGGSRGIGKAICRVFVERGHDVDAPSRNELDLLRPTELDKVCYDIVINNAGINPINDFLAQPTEIMDIMTVNYFSPVSIIKQCLPYMIDNQFGRIVNIGSILMDITKSGRHSYTASKCALHAITKYIAIEYAKHNVLCNTVSPGFVATDMTYRNNSEKDIERIANSIPVQRLAKPEEIAETVYFLTVDNSYINGHNLVIDGGYLCQR